jgi:hypothetical protein
VVSVKLHKKSVEQELFEKQFTLDNQFRTRKVELKTAYKRKPKHRNKEEISETDYEVIYD